MLPGGQTNVSDIGVGRQLLCKEKPNTHATSACAKKLTATVKAAKRGLTIYQENLWRKYVYTSALLQAQRFCDAKSKAYQFASGVPGKREMGGRRLTAAQLYNKCIAEVLSGTRKIEGPFKTKFNWANYLINGAKVIKNLPPEIDTKTNPSE